MLKPGVTLCATWDKSIDVPEFTRVNLPTSMLSKKHTYSYTSLILCIDHNKFIIIYIMYKKKCTISTSKHDTVKKINQNMSK